MDKREFWSYLERLISETEIVVDRPKDSSHQRYPDLVYRLVNLSESWRPQALICMGYPAHIPPLRARKTSR